MGLLGPMIAFQNTIPELSISFQELIAHGLSNVVGSNFLCYTMSVSLSRSMVQESAGGKSQLTGLIQSLLVVVVILAAADLFYTLPNVRVKASLRSNRVSIA